MNIKQAGFTLIELVMVITILGILAAVAVPKFIDLQTDARLAATKGVAAAVTSGFAINYAAAAVGNTGSVAITAAVLDVSAAAGSVMGAGGMPTNYTATAAASSVACGTAGLNIAITVKNGTDTGSQTAGATLICTG